MLFQSTSIRLYLFFYSGDIILHLLQLGVGGCHAFEFFFGCSEGTFEVAGRGVCEVLHDLLYSLGVGYVLSDGTIVGLELFLRLLECIGVLLTGISESLHLVLAVLSLTFELIEYRTRNLGVSGDDDLSGLSFCHIYERVCNLFTAKVRRKRGEYGTSCFLSRRGAGIIVNLHQK